ncbi:hypothetical protein GLAREA_01176 [Glarea lozoyensis ATCC 20868]|uniref:Cupredoxin n=1 Tax=Glarea lozoyensis (strain ATCC 20868 / MF5171) TaxID=1116229 RepID=S3CJ60_GLAL2|nr:uncharacterized protein GLAREA_01176 [Glarea lozoyensis ATCC 20868]EPE25264.1 hypothetical protein GLAREA_01176 [Glarea lozoyensis ATCC 20868]
MKSHVPLLIFLTSLTVAKSFAIAAGLIPQRFTPDVITGVQFNDIVAFFFIGNGTHTVTSGPSPCVADGRFHSGEISGKPLNADGSAPIDATLFAFRLTSDNPVYFYSATGTDCKDGMVGVVNPRLPNDLDQYRKIAATRDKASAPGISGGGIVVVGGQVTITRTHSATTETMVVVPSSSENGWHVNFGDRTSSLSGMSTGTGSVVKTTSLPVEQMVGTTANSASAIMSMGRSSANGTPLSPSASTSIRKTSAGSSNNNPTAKPTNDASTAPTATPTTTSAGTLTETKTSTGSQNSFAAISIIVCVVVVVMSSSVILFGW